MKQQWPSVTNEKDRILKSCTLHAKRKPFLWYKIAGIVVLSWNEKNKSSFYNISLT